MLRAPVLLIVATLLLAAPARAQITVAPVPISPSGRVVQGIELATNAGRTAVLLDTYLQSSSQRASDFAVLARVGQGSRPGRVQRLPGGGSAGGMDVAVGADGTAVAAWVDDKPRRVALVRVAIAPPGRAFGTPQTVTSASTRFSQQLAGVAVTATGRAVVAWLEPEDLGRAVRAAVREPGARFGDPVTLDAGTRAEQPVVTVDPTGRVLAAWSVFPAPPATATVVARILGARATRFAAPVILTQPPAYGAGRLAPVGGTGGAGVTWRERAASAFGAPVVRMLSLLTSRGQFATSRLPFPIAELSTGLDSLQLTIPSTGRVVAAWADMLQRGLTPRIASSTVRTSTRASGQTGFSPPEQRSATGWIASPPALAALGDRSVIAWAERRQGTSRLRIAQRPDRGAWTAPQSVPRARATAVTAAGSRRRVAIAWIQQTGAGRPGTARLAWITR